MTQQIQPINRYGIIEGRGDQGPARRALKRLWHQPAILLGALGLLGLTISCGDSDSGSREPTAGRSTSNDVSGSDGTGSGDDGGDDTTTTDDGNDDGTTDNGFDTLTGTADQLSGDFQRCAYPLLGLPADIYLKEVITFSGTNFVYDVSLTDTDDCSSVDLILDSYAGSFSVPANTQVDLTFESVQRTIFTEEITLIANAEEMCEISDWEVEVERDVEAQDCSVSFDSDVFYQKMPDVGDQIFLSFGADSSTNELHFSKVIPLTPGNSRATQRDSKPFVPE